MEVKDLIRHSPQRIRNDQKLMDLYISFFKKEFGHEPNCVPCTFERDFRKLVNRYKTPKNSNMIFKLKNKYLDKILRYTENGRKHRRFGHLLDPDFVEGYLKHGTEKELKERRLQFDILPEEPEIPVIDLKTAKKSELLKYAEENEIDLGEATLVDEIRSLLLEKGVKVQTEDEEE